MNTSVIILAGGFGARFNSTIPKQYTYLLNKTIIEHAINSFINHDLISNVMVVISNNDLELYKNSTKSFLGNKKLLEPVFGGKNRQESALNGLIKLSEINPNYVLIHDCARPIVANEDINNILNNLSNKVAIVLGRKVFDTLKEVESGNIKSTIDRSKVFRAFTPQAFDYKTILNLHSKYKGIEFTDDSQLFEKEGLCVKVLDSVKQYPKITVQEDIEMLELMISKGNETRIGSGFDVHQFKEGSGIWLGGIFIEHNMSVLAHSDGDVVLHALTDAILGSIAEGDIGVHFPPSDDRWKNKASIHFLDYSMSLLKEKGGHIINADITILLEEPKISKYREQMIEVISKSLNIDKTRISIKATTTEKLGFIGRKEGLAASAVVSVSMPKS